METIKYRISKPKNYTDRDGNEKTFWNNVGTITRFTDENGKTNTLLEIPAIGLEAQVFQIKEKTDDSEAL